MKRLLIICLAILSVKTVSQTLNYEEAFGNDYTKALKLIKQNEALFNRYANLYQIDEKFLKAIVFPELIRYNSVYDAIEITSLQFLYIKKGSDYNDFSVGHFQMKPSFAERIEMDANKTLDTSFLKKIGFDTYKHSEATRFEREQRLNRITNIEDQLKYLIVFYKICELKFKNEQFKTESEKLKLYATAYNSGYFKSITVLKRHQRINSFYTGKMIKSEAYNYANISSFYFEN